MQNSLDLPFPDLAVLEVRHKAGHVRRLHDGVVPSDGDVLAGSRHQLGLDGQRHLFTGPSLVDAPSQQVRLLLAGHLDLGLQAGGHAASLAPVLAARLLPVGDRAAHHALARQHRVVAVHQVLQAQGRRRQLTGCLFQL